MYELKWNSDHPGKVVFLLDLSESMEKHNKINYLIQSVHATIEELVFQCRTEAGSSERVEISIYGYNCRVIDLWKNYSVKACVQELIAAQQQDRLIFDSNGNAKPEHQTCMALAFKKAKEDIQEWINHQATKGITNIPAPLVIHFTDGRPYETTDQNDDEVIERTLKAAKDLLSIATIDGNVRLFNIHYNPQSSDVTLRFPSTQPSDKWTRLLYHASSSLTAKMAESANIIFSFRDAKEGAKALISNEKDPSRITNFLSWGSSQGVRPISDAN